jgi:hypothetical protein
MTRCSALKGSPRPTRRWGGVRYAPCAPGHRRRLAGRPCEGREALEMRRSSSHAPLDRIAAGASCQRCHQRCAVATETELARAAPLSEQPLNHPDQGQLPCRSELRVSVNTRPGPPDCSSCGTAETHDGPGRPPFSRSQPLWADHLDPLFPQHRCPRSFARVRPGMSCR